MTTPSEKNQALAATGRLSAAVGVSSEPAAVLGLDRTVAIRLGILAGLFALLHFQQINVLVRAWSKDANWSHCFLIPLFSLYLIYERRGDIAQSPARSFWPGLVVMILGLGMEVFGTVLMPNHWILNVGTVVTLFGLVLFLSGWRRMRLLWLPVLYLLLAVPIPNSLYVRIAYPLQEFAAQGAVFILNGLGVHIERTASQLNLTSRSGLRYPLTVAEACSGMRSLMAFFALAVAMAYLEDRPNWQRLVMVAAGIPIAIVCNVLRVGITCSMYYIDKPELGKDVMHTLTGLLMLVPALAMLFLLGRLLRLFGPYDEDPDEAEDDNQPASSEQEVAR